MVLLIFEIKKKKNALYFCSKVFVVAGSSLLLCFLLYFVVGKTLKLQWEASHFLIFLSVENWGMWLRSSCSSWALAWWSLVVAKGLSCSVHGIFRPWEQRLPLTDRRQISLAETDQGSPLIVVLAWTDLMTGSVEWIFIQGLSGHVDTPWWSEISLTVQFLPHVTFGNH